MKILISILMLMVLVGCEKEKDAGYYREKYNKCDHEIYQLKKKYEPDECKELTGEVRVQYITSFNAGEMYVSIAYASSYYNCDGFLFELVQNGLDDSKKQKYKLIPVIGATKK